MSKAASRLPQKTPTVNQLLAKASLVRVADIGQQILYHRSVAYAADALVIDRRIKNPAKIRQAKHLSNKHRRIAHRLEARDDAGRLFDRWCKRFGQKPNARQRAAFCATAVKLLAMPRTATGWIAVKASEG